MSSSVKITEGSGACDSGTIPEEANASHESNRTLCDGCRDLGLAEHKFVIPADEPGRFYGSGSKLIEASLDRRDLGYLDEICNKQATCAFCRLIINTARCQTGQAIGTDGRKAGGQRVLCKVEWVLDERGTDNEPKTRRLRVFDQDASFSEFYVVPVGKGARGRVINDTKVDSRLPSTWYSHCKAWHEKCNRSHPAASETGSFIPKRLVFVHQDQLRLCITAEELIEPHTPYATLSYVWGGPNQFKLSSANIYKLKERIPSEDLPRTVLDAIHFIRELGIQYIWVDALCIIQNQYDDASQQILLMDTIFQHATLTVCAAYGSDSSAGIPGIGTGAGRTKQNVEPYEDSLSLMTLKPVENLIRASPWDGRAWTFQERILSRRCVIFTAEGVIWQCPTATWREDIACSLTHAVWTLDFVASPFQRLDAIHLRSYSSCVNIYSGRKLTVIKDKLPAFTGLQATLGRALDSGFHCGLPSRYFDWALLWEPEFAGSRIIEWYPSWSWCGWMQQVNWKHSTIEGTLLNLNNWMVNHTWIEWRIGGEADWDLVWCKNDNPLSMTPPQRWDGYQPEGHDAYGRSQEAIDRLHERRMHHASSVDGSENYALPPYHESLRDCLAFQTFTAHFSLSTISMGRPIITIDSEDRQIRRFGIVDKSGDWCGTVILEDAWLDQVDQVFEFAAISDAKEFSLDELDTWTYYIPEERHQAEWYCFYAIMLKESWRVEKGSNVYGERAGLAKIFQRSFFGGSLHGCSWKSIILR